MLRFENVDAAILAGGVDAAGGIDGEREAFAHAAAGDPFERAIRIDGAEVGIVYPTKTIINSLYSYRAGDARRNNLNKEKGIGT